MTDRSAETVPFSILLVDPDPRTAEMLVAGLPPGFRVEHVPDTRAAMLCMGDRRYNALLTAQALDHDDGIDIAIAGTMWDWRMRVVLLVEKPLGRRDRMSCEAVRAHVLSKPLNIDALREILLPQASEKQHLRGINDVKSRI